jgi:hypothetical protein
MAFLVTASLAPALQAANITGSIGFGSLGAAVSGGSFAMATNFSLTGPFITTENGIYTGVPLSTTVMYSGFQFDPAIVSMNSLWSFSVGAVDYSYDMTSIVSFYDSTHNEWDIGGNGIAYATGYSPTPGTWNVNLSQSGASIVFDSSTAVTPVPEPSMIILMSGGLMGLAGLGRKLKH